MVWIIHLVSCSSSFKQFLFRDLFSRMGYLTWKKILSLHLQGHALLILTCSHHGAHVTDTCCTLIRQVVRTDILRFEYFTLMVFARLSLNNNNINKFLLKALGQHSWEGRLVSYINPSTLFCQQPWEKILAGFELGAGRNVTKHFLWPSNNSVTLHTIIIIDFKFWHMTCNFRSKS